VVASIRYFLDVVREERFEGPKLEYVERCVAKNLSARFGIGDEKSHDLFRPIYWALCCQSEKMFFLVPYHDGSADPFDVNFRLKRNYSFERDLVKTIEDKYGRTIQDRIETDKNLNF
jgi:hypothetical protein